MKSALLMGLLLLSIQTYAQPVSVRAFTDKQKVLLGEPFWLTLEVKSLNNVKPPAFKVDSLAHFEFITRDSSGVIQRGDTSYYHQYFQLRSFDSGRWVIPPFTLRPFVKTSSLLIDVMFTENFDPRQPYHDVQEIKGVPFKIDADIEKWWYLIAAFLIFLTLLIYWLTGPRKPAAVRKRSGSATPFVKAVNSLEDLKKSQPEEKLFYAQLVEIFRDYIAERTGITSQQQTSNNLIGKIKLLMADEVKYESLAQVLYLCDFVKFAKYHPEHSEAASAFEVIEDAIHYIEETLKRQPGLVSEE